MSITNHEKNMLIEIVELVVLPIGLVTLRVGQSNQDLTIIGLGPYDKFNLLPCNFFFAPINICYEQIL